MDKILNYINGEFIESLDKSWINNVDPSIGKVYSLIPDSEDKDIEQAVQSAELAFDNWSNSSVDYRSKILNNIAKLILKNMEDLARAESIDNGKPLSLAKKIDIPRAAKNMAFFASAIKHDSSESHQMNNIAINYTLRKPIGVVGCISPWNLPLYLFTWKIAPALAAGNTVIAKPSEVTPMTAYLFSKICKEAGLPDGVLNIVHGYGGKVGAAITKHPKIKAISFTGGTATGKEIAKVAAPMFKKMSLELGGKNPNIVFADCDFEKAVSTSVLSSFSNQGQICLCGSRIYIERKIYDKFKEAFLKKVKKLVVQDPLSESTQIGALVSEDHMNKVITKDKVKAFTENDVASVYKMYWELMKCNELPKGMDLCVFDFAVYREPKIAQRELQYVLGAKRDTWIGPITIGLLESMVAEKGISATIDTYQDHRKAWIDKLTSATESEKTTFKARVDTITAAAKGMV